MKNNRLKLDFSIPTAIGRQEFLNIYLSQPQFKEYPPTEEELETMGNYLLYGKDEDGKNVTQRKEIFIKSKYSDWDNAKAEDSLDELMESPAFNEATLRKITTNHYKVKRQKFCREDVLKTAPSELVPEFEQLFHRIDELDLIINFYDLHHGRRKNPPRDALLHRFTEKEIADAEEASRHINAFNYLKKRHLLIELRREQYTMRDMYQSTIAQNPVQRYALQLDQPTPTFDTEIEIYPLWLDNDSDLAKAIFIPFSDFGRPETIPDEPLLKKITYEMWHKKEAIRGKHFFDFSSIEHLYYLMGLYFEFHSARFDPDTDSTVPSFFKTLEYYMEQADLSELEQEVLQLKVQKVKNADIVNYLKEKYNKQYTQNYISTIYKQRILGKIAAAASYHCELIENLAFPENFKQCYRCKKMYLRTPDNFVRKKTAKDGLTNRCKNCDKEVRRVRNEKYQSKKSD